MSTMVYICCIGNYNKIFYVNVKYGTRSESHISHLHKIFIVPLGKF